MKNTNSVKSLCQKFWQFESVSGIFSDATYSPAWHMIRMKAYYHLATNNKVFTVPHPYDRNSKWRLKFFFRCWLYLVGSIIVFFKNLSTEIVVVEHHRTKKYRGTPVDIYSYFYINKLKKLGASFLIFSRTDSGRVEKNDGFQRVSIDLIELTRSVFSYLFLPFIRCRNSYILAEAHRLLDPKVVYLLRRARLEFLFSYIVYKFAFLLLYNVKTLIVVDGYSSRAGMIMAAKSKGIKVIELQHGVATKYHLGYSYPANKYNSKCIPDELLVWSDFWCNSLEKICPIPVRVNKENYIVHESKRYDVQDKEDSIVVLSQGAISFLLADCVLENIEKFKDIDVYYKLHPSEYETWVYNKSLVYLSNLKNVHIVEDTDLYGLLARCKYQLGVFSTALFEGIELRCKLVLADLPGIEYWEDLSINYTLLDDWSANAQ